MIARVLLGLGTVLGLLLPGPAGAQGSAVTRHVLPNGVRVLVREDASAGVVAISLQVRAGSRFETPETAGITNFLHRVMARGAARRSGDELAEAAEQIGGSLDASGDVESAEVRGTALATHWETLLRLVSDVAIEPTLAPGEIDKERRLILGQIRTRADTPFPAALDALLADLYGPHPYALPSLGRRASVERLAREDLVAHHRAVYRADRLVLAVSGRVERERVIRLAGRLLGAVPAAGEQPLGAPPTPRPLGRRRTIERPAHQTQVLVGYLAPPMGEPDYAAAKVLAALLGGGMSGRLFRELREREGLAYALGALYPSRTGPAPLVTYLGTAPENAAGAEASMLREIERVRTEGASEPEVGRARAYALGSLAMDRRTNARHAWYLAFFEVSGVGWEFPDRYGRALGAVTAAQVVAVARRYLTQPTIVVLGPR